MGYFANMHTHSTYSDGFYSPLELCQKARYEGFGAICLTDHDTLCGYDEFKEACFKNSLECIFGVEFTTNSALGKSFHILGYDVDVNNKELNDYLDALSQSESQKTKIIFNWALDSGRIKNLTWDEVVSLNKNVKRLTSEHIFYSLLKKGEVKITDYEDFYDDNFKMQKDLVPCSFEYKSPEEIISLINDANGISVLAHGQDDYAFLDTLVLYGLKGIECIHPEIDEKTSKIFLEYAKKNNLYITGGSDHYGVCGGMYEAILNKRKSKYYIDNTSYGISKNYFNEVKNRSKG